MYITRLNHPTHLSQSEVGKEEKRFVCWQVAHSFPRCVDKRSINNLGGGGGGMLDLAWHKSGERYIVDGLHKKDLPLPLIFTRADVDCKIGMKMEIHPPLSFYYSPCYFRLPPSAVCRNHSFVRGGDRRMHFWAHAQKFLVPSASMVVRRWRYECSPPILFSLFFGGGREIETRF